MQHDGDMNSPRYFYLHDRLGSVRQIINFSGTVENCYYYTLWGGVTGSETDENVSNWFGWAGYLGDEEISSYYCNARQFNSARFTTRDPISGSFNEPMTLHAYLYCLNDPINRTDPTGEKSLSEMMAATKVWASGVAATGCNYANQAWQFARRILSQIQVRDIVHQIATKGESGLEYAMRMGRQGEYTVQNMLQVAKNTARYYTDAGNYRIPDFVDGSVFYEVKNAATVSLTQQITDLLQIANNAGGVLVLVVRTGTNTDLSGPLQELVDNGSILLLPML
jgi:RHS repeat-associated protein